MNEKLKNEIKAVLDNYAMQMEIDLVGFPSYGSHRSNVASYLKQVGVVTEKIDNLSIIYTNIYFHDKPNISREEFEKRLWNAF
ncbi:MAG: hypothetical protein KUG82_01285 [Pseudomonadales bacterium]|nr:hypothetical protein [Pseudomonadales bacterium]